MRISFKADIAIDQDVLEEGIKHAFQICFSNPNRTYLFCFGCCQRGHVKDKGDKPQTVFVTG